MASLATVAWNKIAGALRRLSRYVFLRPFGGQLLTTGAAFWIFSARTNVALMATSEGVSWGYAGYCLASGWAPPIVAVTTASFIFLVVWILDASFLTLDRWRRHYDCHLEFSKELGQWWKRMAQRFRDDVGVGLRVGVVVSSMIFSAPFLAQLLFTEDIDKVRSQQALDLRAGQRRSIETDLNGQLERTDEALATTRRDLVLEVAGRGPSNTHGYGATARAIESRLKSLEAERERVERARIEMLANFDKSSDQDLARTYGLRFPGDSFQERRDILRGISNGNDNFTLTENAIRAFLAFLFVGMIALKFYEPRAVRVYLSERLQDLYGQYKRGMFDAYLDDKEKSTAGGGMEALRFEDWCLNVYPAVRRQDLERRNRAERVAHYADQVAEVEGASRICRDQEASTRTAIHNTEAEIRRATFDRLTLDQQISAAEVRVKGHADKLEAIERGFKKAGTPSTLASMLKMHADLEAEIADGEETLRLLLPKRQGLSRAEAMLQSELTERQNVLEKLHLRIKQAEHELDVLLTEQFSEIRRQYSKRSESGHKPLQRNDLAVHETTVM